jgi:hypothetical protein
MPNWCHNHVKFAFPSQELYQKFDSAIKDECLFSTFVPLEIDVDEKGQEKWDYRKAIEFWGTKWEPSDIKIEDSPVTMDDSDIELVLTFETAWAPPVGFYERLNKNHGIFVFGMFHEPGEQVFGRCTYRESVEKIDYYNYPETPTQLDRIREVIGINRDLDSYMSIEWERIEERWAEDSDEDLAV